MKLTGKQLRQIIIEELREVMIGPSNPTARALKDPQVDEKIKNLLRMDDPELRKQGVEMLPLLYPDDYSFDDGIGDYQGSEEYEKASKENMSVLKDVAKLRAIKDDFENTLGNVRVSFTLSRLHIVSKDMRTIESAIEYAKEKHNLSPEEQFTPDRLAGNPFILKRSVMGDALFSAMFKLRTEYEPQAVLQMRKMANVKG